ncbi:MAG: AsmA-like C-terminal region-containing protein, partial [Rikenellaceae bacterium]
EKIFTIQKNDLSLNDLKLNLTGSVAVLEGDRYKTDLQLNAPDTKFETLFALVPKDFQKYMEGLTATGDFTLGVKVAGEYYENHLPAIDAVFAVNNSRVKYSQLPEAIENINIDLSVTNPGGSVDSTVVDLRKMSFTVANNPFNLFAKVVNINDPILSGGAVGVINFENLKRALPLKDVTLQGVLNADITFDGKYQYIEKEQYEKFMAKGTVTLKNILFVSKDYPKGVALESGTIVVTPARLNVSNLKAKVYSSDFALQGYISNYLPYIFKDEMLKGSFTLNSNLINLNEFMASADTTATATATAKTAAAPTVITIPKNIDMQLNTNISKVLFDDLTVQNVKGNVQIAGAVASLSNLSMNMLEGRMVMSGKYDTKNPKVPSVDFNLNVSDFDIHSMYNSFSMVKQAVPIAMDCEGKLSVKMKFSAKLDSEMSPVMNTLNGSGSIDTKGLLIKDNPAMNQLASLIDNAELKRLSISKLNINFTIVEGNITVEPFTTMLAGNPMTISGKQSVTGNLDYTMNLTVKREMFGKEINKLLGQVPGSANIKNLDIDVKVGGTLNKPTIKPDLTKAITAVAKEAEKELLDKAKGGILKGIGDLFNKKKK